MEKNTFILDKNILLDTSFVLQSYNIVICDKNER